MASNIFLYQEEVVIFETWLLVKQIHIESV